MNERRYSILCATDFSPSSDEALTWAAALAHRWQAGVDLLHVLPPTEDSKTRSTAVSGVENPERTSANERVHSLAKSAEARWGVPVRGQVLEGDTPGVIARVAQEQGASLIALGSHGRSAIGRWLLGSVADRVIGVAHRPVAVVPPPTSGHSNVPSLTGTPPTWNVTAGVDLGSASERVVAFVAELLRSIPCQVTFLHLYWAPEQFLRLGLQGARSFVDPDRDVVANLEPRMRLCIGAMAEDPRVILRIRPAWGEPSGNLLAAAQEQNADVIVIAAEERHGLSRLLHPSTAAAVTAQVAQVPVICIPPAPSPFKAATTRADQAVVFQLPLLRTILAPTDLSTHGNRAVAYAYALLRAHGGVVEICHVHEHTLPNPPFAYDDTHDRLPPADRAARERELRNLIPADAERFGINTHVSIIDGGNAGQAILQAAERFGADAITVGSHGRSGVARALFGSVAEQVTRGSRRPVLVVPAPD